MVEKIIQLQYREQYKDFNHKLQYVKNVIETGSVYESHFHSCFEFIMVLNGKISGVVNEKKYTIDKKGLLVILPFQYHNVSINPHSEYERITLLFDSQLIPAELYEQFIEIVSETPVILNETTKNLIQRLAGVFSSPYDGNYPMLALHLVSELFYYICFEKNQYIAPAIREALSQVLKYIDEHITEKISLDDIAKHTLLSKSTLCHFFKKTIKVSIKQYVLQKKMAYASQLLAEGVSAQEVAYRVGYENYANFYKMYKRVTNHSPSNSTPPPRSITTGATESFESAIEELRKPTQTD